MADCDYLLCGVDSNYACDYMVYIKNIDTADNVGKKMDQKDKLEDDYDYCYECGGYGNDYSFDDDGDLVCNCDDCPFNPMRPYYFRWKY